MPTWHMCNKVKSLHIDKRIIIAPWLTVSSISVKCWAWDQQHDRRQRLDSIAPSSTMPIRDLVSWPWELGDYEENLEFTMRNWSLREKHRFYRGNLWVKHGVYWGNIWVKHGVYWGNLWVKHGVYRGNLWVNHGVNWRNLSVRHGVYWGNLKFTRKTWNLLGKPEVYKENMEFTGETWRLQGKHGVYWGNFELMRRTWVL